MKVLGLFFDIMDKKKLFYIQFIVLYLKRRKIIPYH